MLDQLVASFAVTGIVTEKRELTSPKNTSWRGYVTKVACLGKTMEVTVSAPDFSKMEESQVVRMTGHFDEIGGRLKLIADKVVQVQAAKPA